MTRDRQLIVHRSLTSPELLAGAERELVILLWTAVFALIFGGGIRPLSLFVGLLLGLGGHYGLVQAAKSDPQWFRSTGAACTTAPFTRRTRTHGRGSHDGNRLFHSRRAYGST